MLLSKRKIFSWAPPASDRELASAVNVLVVSQVESTKAGLGEVSQEDVPSLAKIGLPHLVTPLEVRGGEFLIRLRVSNRNHIVSANFRSY